MSTRTAHRLAGVFATALAVVLLPAVPATATSDVEQAERDLTESERQLEEAGNELNALGERVSEAQQAYEQATVKLEATRAQLDAQQVVVADLEILVARGIRDAAMGRGGDVERFVAFTRGGGDLEDTLNGIATFEHFLRSRGASYDEYREALDKLAELEESTGTLQAEAEAELARANELQAQAETEYAEIEQLVLANRSDLRDAEAVEAAMAAGRAAQQDQASRDGGRTEIPPAPDWGGGAINCGGTSVTPPNATVASAIQWACARLGLAYCYGGTGPSCYDCSGFTQAAYAQAGVALPRTAASQGGAGTTVSRSNIIPGDLIVTNNSGHIGIYLGNNVMIHSPHTGDVVKVSPLSYFGFVTAARVA